MEYIRPDHQVPIVLKFMNCLNLFLYKKSQYYKLASNTELCKVNILQRKLQYLMPTMHEARRDIAGVVM